MAHHKGKKHKPNPKPADTPKTFVPKDLSKNDNESLGDVLQRMHIHRWDWLLVGDGSGSNWNYQCGWGCISIERITLDRQLWYGAMNRGTVNFAEMLAYLQPLNWISGREEERRKATGRRRIRNVHIITDSEYCRNQGDSEDLMPHRNGALWRVFDDFQRHGLVLHWHWLPRTNVALNVYADALSKAVRHLLRSHDVQKMVEQDAMGQIARTAYDYNPVD